MAKFVKLTGVGGEVITVNVEQVRSLIAYGDSVAIAFSKDHYVNVKGTTDQILQQLRS